MGFIPNNGTNFQTYLNLRLNRNEVVAELEKLTYDTAGRYYILKRVDGYTAIQSNDPTDLYVEKENGVYFIRANVIESSNGTRVFTYFESDTLAGWRTYNEGVGCVTVQALNGYTWTNLQASSASNLIGVQNNLLTNLISTEKFIYKQPNCRFYGEPILGYANNIEKIYVNTKLSDEAIKNLFAGIIKDMGLEPNSSTPVLLSSMEDTYAGTMILIVGSDHTDDNPSFSLFYVSFGYRMDIFYDCRDGFVNCYPNDYLEYNKPNFLSKMAIDAGIDVSMVADIYNRLSCFLSPAPFEEAPIVTGLSNYLTTIADSIRQTKGTTANINAQDFAWEISNLNFSLGHNGMVEGNYALIPTAVATIVQEMIDSGVKVYRHSITEAGMQKIRIYHGDEMPTYIMPNEDLTGTIYENKTLTLVGITQAEYEFARNLIGSGVGMLLVILQSAMSLFSVEIPRNWQTKTFNYKLIESPEFPPNLIIRLAGQCLVDDFLLCEPMIYLAISSL